MNFESTLIASVFFQVNVITLPRVPQMDSFGYVVKIK